MGAFNLKRFAKPEVLKRMRPQSLWDLLEPYRSYLTGRNLDLDPLSVGGSFEYDRLVEVLLNPSPQTPDALANALYLINELSTREGLDALEGSPDLASVFVDLDPEVTPADVAARCWLRNAKAVEQVFAETRLLQPRSFEYSASRPWPPLPLRWTKESQKSLEEALGDWFLKRRRGRGVRVLSGESDGEVWFVVRHGDPFRREGALEKGESKSVLFRPEKFDVLVYSPSSGELRINARSKGEKDLYRAAFGAHLFGKDDYFADMSKYTLEPLRQSGSASLVCSDVEGLELVVLKELTIFWGGPFGEEENRRAKDLMAAYERRGHGIPKKARLRRAKFEMKFSDGRPPRMVTVALPNRTQLKRDEDGALVQEWLVLRGFAPRRGSVEHEEA